MFYVYILKFSNNQLYTGFTSDLKRRARQHDSGGVKSTRNRRPFKLIHYEAYLLESDARRRGKYLKSSDGKKMLRFQIGDLLENI